MTRYRSLDVLRGMTVALMILVNTQGTGTHAYPELVHAAWFGFTFADVVFPSFLFAMGTALAFAGRSHVPDRLFWRGLARRTVILFALGVLLYWFPFFQHDAQGGWMVKPVADLRIMGVLQRTALCYALAAVAARYLTPRGLVWLCVGLLGGYWAIMLGLRPPETALTRDGNVGNAVDLFVLGRRHLFTWDHGFEPEGLLGTLPATVNVLAGFLAGRRLAAGGIGAGVLRPMALTGAALVAVALLAQPFVPIGKKLWTPSFVVLTCGIDLILLAVLVAWIEPAKARPGTTMFMAFGRNPLVLYLFSEALAVVLNLIPAGRGTLWQWFCIDLVQRVLPGPMGALACALVVCGVCWLLAHALYRRGILIRI